MTDTTSRKPQSATAKWRRRALAAERDRDAAQAKYDDLVGQLLIDLCDVLTERGHLEGPVMHTWLTTHGYLPEGPQ